MLVLSRKVGESIVIADEITITVLECKGNYTRVGITAPREISVQREEIQLRLMKEREDGESGIEAGSLASGEQQPERQLKSTSSAS